MPPRFQFYLTLAGTILTTLAAALPAAAVSLYSISNLGDLQPLDLNDSGQVIGTASDRSWLWDKGATTDLTAIGASAINNKGDIVGTAGGQLFWRRSDGTVINLGSPICQPGFSGCRYLQAYKISDRGDILTQVYLGTGSNYPGRALTWRDSSGKTATVFTETNPYSNLNGRATISDRGQIAYSTLAGRFLITGSALVWHQGNETNLAAPPLTGMLPSHSLQAKDINNQGQAVGLAEYSQSLYWYKPDRTRALLWDRSATTGRDLGTLGGDNSTANAINNLGLIVGWANAASGKQQAAIWSNNQIYNLNNLLVNGDGWELTSALKINNKEQIIGLGYYQGKQQAFLLNPASKSVPEPSATLALLGAIALLGSRGDKKQGGKGSRGDE